MSRRTVKQTVNVKIELYLDVDVEATVVHDPNYGADADGNRGVGCTWVDETVVKNMDSVRAQALAQVDDMIVELAEEMVDVDADEREG